MAVDPESLLIFKTRETEETPKKKKNNEFNLKSVEEPMLPEPESEKELKLGKYQEEKKQAAPVQKAQPIQEEEQKPKIIEQQKTEPSIAQTKREIIQPMQEEMPKQSIYGQQAQPAEEEDKSSVKVYANDEYTFKKSSRKKQESMSREAAKGQVCVWHPWRQAYAICNYCHRPFCFEDTIEYNKNYYCLQDIDNVSLGFGEKVNSRGHTINIIAGIMLMASFLIFFYYSNAQVLFVLQYFHKVGVQAFALKTTIPYLYPLGESLLMTLLFIDAILIFMQSRRSFLIGVILCIVTVALFTYQYINTTTYYLIIVDGLVFLSFLVLLYSKAVYVGEETTTSRATVESNVLRWPNVGKF